jgi:hypothetical protein
MRDASWIHHSEARLKVPAQRPALLARLGREGYAMHILRMCKGAVVAEAETQVGVAVPCKFESQFIIPFHPSLVRLDLHRCRYIIPFSLLHLTYIFCKCQFWVLLGTTKIPHGGYNSSSGRMSVDMCGKGIDCAGKGKTTGATTLCTTNHVTAVKMRKGFCKRFGHTK